MTISPERASRTMSDLIAEEIRVALTRQRISQRQFAVKLGVSPAWLNYRLTGVQEIGVNDLRRIADALGVSIYDLLPPPEIADQAAHTPVQAKIRSVKEPFLSDGDHLTPRRERTMHASPVRQPRVDSRRPVSAILATRRRPQPVVGPGNRPKAA